MRSTPTDNEEWSSGSDFQSLLNKYSSSYSQVRPGDMLSSFHLLSNLSTASLLLIRLNTLSQAVELYSHGQAPVLFAMALTAASAASGTC